MWLQNLLIIFVVVVFSFAQYRALISPFFRTNTVKRFIRDHQFVSRLDMWRIREHSPNRCILVMRSAYSQPSLYHQVYDQLSILSISTNSLAAEVYCFNQPLMRSEISQTFTPPLHLFASCFGSGDCIYSEISLADINSLIDLQSHQKFSSCDHTLCNDHGLYVPLVVDENMVGVLRLLIRVNESSIPLDNKVFSLSILTAKVISETLRPSYSRSIDNGKASGDKSVAEYQQSLSALQALRTFAKLLRRRLKKDDEVGEELVENILVQSESIQNSLSATFDFGQEQAVPSGSLNVLIPFHPNEENEVIFQASKWESHIDLEKISTSNRSFPLFGTASATAGNETKLQVWN